MPLQPVIDTGHQAERVIDITHALGITETDVLDILLYCEAITDTLEQRLHDLGGRTLAAVAFYVGGHVDTFDPTMPPTITITNNAIGMVA